MLAVLALVVILAPLINGPIFRKVVHSQLEKVLHNLYLEGGFEAWEEALVNPSLPSTFPRQEPGGRTPRNT